MTKIDKITKILKYEILNIKAKKGNLEEKLKWNLELTICFPTQKEYKWEHRTFENNFRTKSSKYLIISIIGFMLVLRNEVKLIQTIKGNYKINYNSLRGGVIE